MGSKSWPRHCGRSQLPARRRTPKRRGLCINPDVLYHAHCEHGNALTEYCGMCEFDALYGYPQKIERELARFRSGEISRQLLVQNLEQLGLSEDEIYSIDECKRAKADWLYRLRCIWRVLTLGTPFADHILLSKEDALEVERG